MHSCNFCNSKNLTIDLQDNYDDDGILEVLKGIRCLYCNTFEYKNELGVIDYIIPKFNKCINIIRRKHFEKEKQIESAIIEISNENF